MKALPILKWSAIVASSFCLSLEMTGSENPEGQSQTGSTVVTQWKENKRGVFLMYFDDSLSSHVKNVIPELKKRGMVATFYVNPGGKAWKANQEDWEKNIPASGVAVYGNHTMTHQGCKDFAEAEKEIGPVNDIIEKAFPTGKKRLISYGQPGVPAGKWNISQEELHPLLTKYHLVQRPHRWSAASGLKDAASILAVADKAIRNGAADDILFHGVGGDWIVFDAGEFIKVLDGLAERRGALWITDPISEFQYDTERKTARVEVISVGNRQIRLKLLTRADLNWFDYPLTLQTKVPDGWSKCRVIQAGGISRLVSTNGILMYEAIPDGRTITLEPLNDF